MKSQHFVDETVLADLLKNDLSEVNWKTMFQHYREPFVRYFENQGSCPQRAQSLFREMFALLVTAIRENMLKAPFDHTLFEYLVVLGEKYLAGKPAFSEEDQMNLSPKLRHPFLAGEVLLTLLNTSHEATIKVIHRHYQQSVFAMLKSKYRLNDDVLQEVYGESIALLGDNIRQGKLMLPMEARLFTYFFRVMRNKVLDYNKFLSRMPLMGGAYEDIEKKLSQIPEEEPEPRLEDKYPIPANLSESLLSILEPEDNLFEQLIASLDPLSQDVLRMHFVDGLRYKEVGRRVNLSEGTTRKRVFDGLKKLKKYFSQKQGITKRSY
jgi:RNA polymerase sigma factor (sigma-70 family)